jgi:hypothetical protein
MSWTLLSAGATQKDRDPVSGRQGSIRAAAPKMKTVRSLVVSPIRNASAPATAVSGVALCVQPHVPGIRVRRAGIDNCSVVLPQAADQCLFSPGSPQDTHRGRDHCRITAVPAEMDVPGLIRFPLISNRLIPSGSCSRTEPPEHRTARRSRRPPMADDLATRVHVTGSGSRPRSCAP